MILMLPIITADVPKMLNPLSYPSLCWLTPSCFVQKTDHPAQYRKSYGTSILKRDKYICSRRRPALKEKTIFAVYHTGFILACAKRSYDLLELPTQRGGMPKNQCANAPTFGLSASGCMPSKGQGGVS